MKITRFENKEDWFNFRNKKITGSKLKDIVVLKGKKEKKGYYQLIAERLFKEKQKLNEEENITETPLNRGNRLEKDVLNLLALLLNKDIDDSLIIWQSDFNENIALSPDGIINDNEAVEVKCLASATHIEAFLKKEVPSEYKFQVLQYFIVNENLKTLYFTMYDDRLIDKVALFYIEVKRNDLLEDIKKYKNYQIEKLNLINNIVNSIINT